MPSASASSPSSPPPNECLLVFPLFGEQSGRCPCQTSARKTWRPLQGHSGRHALDIGLLAAAPDESGSLTPPPAAIATGDARARPRDGRREGRGWRPRDSARQWRSHTGRHGRVSRHPSPGGGSLADGMLTLSPAVRIYLATGATDLAAVDRWPVGAGL